MGALLLHIKHTAAVSVKDSSAILHMLGQDDVVVIHDYDMAQGYHTPWNGHCCEALLRGSAKCHV